MTKGPKEEVYLNMFNLFRFAELTSPTSAFLDSSLTHQFNVSVGIGVESQHERINYSVI